MVSETTIQISDYQELANSTDIKKGSPSLDFPLLGLLGEIGGLSSALKKHQREGEKFTNYKEIIQEELGDCLWYLSSICTKLNLKVDDIAANVASEFNSSYQTSIPNLEMNFLEFQQRIVSSEINTPMKFEDTILSLGEEIGKLLETFKKRHMELFTSQIGQMLLLLAKAANEVGANLNEIAKLNILKNKNRWPGDTKKYTPPFDNEFFPEERFPRNLEMKFTQYTRGEKLFVIQSCNGIHVGAALTDNKVEPDGYRFHDVFHISYAVHLGGSPVLRALLKEKRKSDPSTDTNEDGARAIITEEAVSAWIFSKAVKHNYYKNQDSVEYSLLKWIREFVVGYEVERCPLWQWEVAILEGFKVFRLLKENNGGIVHADLLNRTLSFTHP